MNGPGPSARWRRTRSIPFSTFRQATLQSQRIRIIGRILVRLHLAGLSHGPCRGVPDQVRLLPQITLLLLASAAYESSMLSLVGRRRESVAISHCGSGW